MKSWHFRLIGTLLMALGAYLFVVAVRDMTGETLRLSLGLFSVFCVSFGFGLLILPWDSPGFPVDSPSGKAPGENLPPKG